MIAKSWRYPSLILSLCMFGISVPGYLTTIQINHACKAKEGDEIVIVNK
jgi:hypothetical protein